MIPRIKKLSYQDWITGNTAGTDPIKTLWTKTITVREPPTLHTFIKRENGYFFITNIFPDETPPFIVEGYPVSTEQYRYFRLCELLGEDN